MKYDVSALGEILINFTPCGKNEYGYPMYSQNPGGVPSIPKSSEVLAVL